MRQQERNSSTRSGSVALDPDELPPTTLLDGVRARGLGRLAPTVTAAWHAGQRTAAAAALATLHGVPAAATPLAWISRGGEGRVGERAEDEPAAPWTTEGDAPVGVYRVAPTSATESVGVEPLYSDMTCAPTAVAPPLAHESPRWTAGVTRLYRGGTSWEETLYDDVREYDAGLFSSEVASSPPSLRQLKIASTPMSEEARRAAVSPKEYAAFLLRAAKRQGASCTTSKVATTVECVAELHDPLQTGTPFWDPFASTGWWESSIDEGKISLCDALGNTIEPIILARHPLRRWIAMHLLEMAPEAPEGAKANALVLENLSMPWVVEQELVKRYGVAVGVDPPSRRWAWTFPSESGISPPSSTPRVKLEPAEVASPTKRQTSPTPSDVKSDRPRRKASKGNLQGPSDDRPEPSLTTSDFPLLSEATASLTFPLDSGSPQRNPSEDVDGTVVVDPREKSSKRDKADKRDKSDKLEKSDRRDKSERADKSEKRDKGEKLDKSERRSKSDKLEKSERRDKSEKREKKDKT